MNRTLTSRSRRRRGAASRTPGRVAVHRDRGHAAAVKRAAMNSACSTLTQKPSARTLRRSATRRASCAQDQVGARVVAGVEVAKRAEVVAAARPAHVAQVDAVGDAVVLERHEELAVERVPQAQLGGDVAVEVGQQRLAVAALGRRGEADAGSRAQPRDDGLVRVGRDVVALVDDDVAEVVGAEPVDERRSSRALDGREHVVATLGLVAAVEQLAERRVLQHVAEGVARLRRGSRRDARGTAGAARPRSAASWRSVVERGDDRLAGAGRRDDQVAGATVDVALGGEPVEDLLLEGQGRRAITRNASARGRRLGG